MKENRSPVPVMKAARFLKRSKSSSISPLRLCFAALFLISSTIFLSCGGSETISSRSLKPRMSGLSDGESGSVRPPTPPWQIDTGSVEVPESVARGDELVEQGNLTAAVDQYRKAEKDSAGGMATTPEPNRPSRGVSAPCLN